MSEEAGREGEERRAHIVDVVRDPSVPVPFGDVYLGAPAVREIHKPQCRLQIRKNISATPPPTQERRTKPKRTQDL